MILKTDRLQLREMTLEDADNLHLVFSDPIAMQHYPKTFDQEMTIHWIESNVRRYADYGIGLWAVTLQQENRVIGDCGLTIQIVDGTPELEVGFHILRTLWNQGFATEAAAACRDYAFNQLKKNRLISWMNPQNFASRRVAEKLGMSLEKETIDNRNRRAVVYAMAPSGRKIIGSSTESFRHAKRSIEERSL